MKTNQFQLILFCFCLIAITFSCEKADLQKSLPKDNVKITNRVADDCEDCPNVDDCCCSISIQSGEDADFQICGTTDGDAVNCSDDSGCTYEVDGLQHSFFNLSGSNLTEIFCMAPTTAFWIKRTTLSGTTTIAITCQHGQGSPQVVNFVATGPFKRFYDVSDECELTGCPN